MRIGDYVRTKFGRICKIYNLTVDYSSELILCERPISKHQIIKSKPDIIDLVQEGDYVNGEKITRVIPEDVCGDEVLDYQHIFVGDKEIFKEDIKSIVTKEEFEAMEYKVGK